MPDVEIGSSKYAKSAKNAKGHVRIIGGLLKHRRIPVLNRPNLRPTPDRVRETLFNWLTPDLLHSHVLEPFAGSGILSFEALSRGAAYALINDYDRQSVSLLRQNSRLLNIQEQVQILCVDALNLLNKTPQKPFNIIFLDPPYQLNLLPPTILLLENYAWLAPGALIYLEAPTKMSIKIPQHWQLWRQMQAGQVLAQLYQRTEWKDT